MPPLHVSVCPVSNLMIKYNDFLLSVLVCSIKIIIITITADPALSSQVCSATNRYMSTVLNGKNKYDNASVYNN